MDAVVDVYFLLFRQESILCRKAHCQQTGEPIAFGGIDNLLDLLHLVSHRNMERSSKTFMTKAGCPAFAIHVFLCRLPSYRYKIFCLFYFISGICLRISVFTLLKKCLGFEQITHGGNARFVVVFIKTEILGCLFN